MSALSSLRLWSLLQLNQNQLTQLMSSVSSSQDEAQSRQLPDCVQEAGGLVLTELGRQQVRRDAGAGGAAAETRPDCVCSADDERTAQV